MAKVGRIKGITIELSADTSKATQSLDKFEKASSRIAKELKDIQSVLKFNPASVEALTQKQEALKKQVETVNDQLNKEKAALEQLKNGEQTEKTVEQQRKLKLQIEETTAKLKDAETQYKSFGSVGVQQCKAVGEQMQKMGASITSAGRSLTRHITAPIAALGTLSVKELANFEQGMAQVGAISQASGEEVDQMSTYARNLAATTKFTAGEVTEAYKYMALAGWESTEMMGGLEGVLNLVSASGEDLGRVSDIVTDGLTMFGLSAEDSTHFADVLAVAMSKSNTTVDLLGEALKYVGPVAGQMGYNFEDLATAMGIMANSGIKGSTAGTSMRNILTRMAKPTKEVATAMEELGLSLDDGQGNMYSFEEVMQQMRSAFGELKIPMDEYQESLTMLDEALEEGVITEAEYNDEMQRLTERAFGAEGALKAQAASTIAGQRGMAGLMAIVGASQEEWDGLANAINNADGTAESMRETMENTLSGQLTILKSQLSELAMQFGEILMPALREFVAWLQNLVTGFQQLSPATKRTIVMVAALAAALGPLLLIGGKLMQGMGSLLTMPAKLTAGLAKLSTALSIPSATILGIVAVIAVLIAAFADLMKNNEEFRKRITAAFKKIQAAGQKLFGGLTEGVGELLEAFKPAWDWFKNQLAPIFIAAFELIASSFEGAVDVILGVLKVFKSIFTKDWKGLWEGIKQIFNGFKTILGGIANAIKTLVLGVFRNLRDQVLAVFRNLRENGAAIFRALRDTVSQVVQNLREKVVEKFRALREAAVTIIQTLREGIVARIRAMRDTVRDVIQDMREKIVEKFRAARTTAAEVIQDMREKVEKKARDLRTNVETIFNKIKENITSPFESAKKTVEEAVQKIKNLFPLRLGKIFDGIKLPHFKIDGGEIPWGIGGKGKKPSISIDWYKKAMQNGMILDHPTIFGYANGKFLAGGDAGSETVVGTSSLLGMIQQATKQNTVNPELIYQAVRQGASEATIRAYLDGKDVTSAVNRGITMSQNYNARFQGA